MSNQKVPPSCLATLLYEHYIQFVVKIWNVIGAYDLGNIGLQRSQNLDSTTFRLRIAPTTSTLGHVSVTKNRRPRHMKYVPLENITLGANIIASLQGCNVKTVSHSKDNNYSETHCTIVKNESRKHVRPVPLERCVTRSGTEAARNCAAHTRISA